MFVRDEGQGPAAIAVTDAEGRFELATGEQRGAVPGSYRVTVKKDNSDELGIPDPLPAGMTRTGYMRQHDLVPRPLLPLDYANVRQTPLRFTVSASDENEFVIHLKGEPPAASQRAGRVTRIAP